MFPEPKTFNGSPGEVYGDFKNSGARHGGFRCLDCQWTGRTGASAYQHHSVGHHRIEITRCHIRQQFSCCKEDECTFADTA